MRKQTLSILAVFATLFALSPAQAADYEAPPPLPPAYTWSGFYLGGHLGYGQANATVNSLPDVGVWGLGTATLKSDGVLGGGQLGYWFHTDSGFAFGLDASLTATDLSKSIASPVVGTDIWRTSVRTVGLAQGRLGWGNDDWLIFMQGGYGGVRASARATDPVGLNGSVNDSHWHNGWTVGAGLLYRLAPNFSLGAEYSYVKTQSKLYDWDVPDNISVEVERARVDHSIHMFKLVGNFHFWAP